MARKKKKKEARFGELDAYLFGQATHYEIYEKMGAHLDVKDGKKAVWFTVWAPNAQGVSVVGDFNGWEDDANPMEKVAEMGVYEVFIPESKRGLSTNTALRPGTAGVFTRRIPTGSGRRNVREPLPEWWRSAALSGRMKPG